MLLKSEDTSNISIKKMNTTNLSKKFCTVESEVEAVVSKFRTATGMKIAVKDDNICSRVMSPR